MLVRRLEAPKRDKQAITKVLIQGLTAAAKGRCTSGELVAELKHWRRGHPSYFRGRWNTASLRAAHANALRALDEAEEAWWVLLRHAHRGNTSRSKSFAKAIGEARMQLNGTRGLPPASS